MNADVNHVVIIYKINFTLHYDSVYWLSGLNTCLLTNNATDKHICFNKYLLLQSTMDFCISHYIDLCQNVYNVNNNFMNNI